MKILPMAQLTFYEREQIEHGLRVGETHNAIGMKLGRDHSVIDREVDRNSSPFIPYTAVSAQRAFEFRKRLKHKSKLEKFENQDLREYVIARINEDWSPEEIAGRLKNKLVQNINDTISHESIYQYIYNGEGRFENLYQHLRTGRPKRRRKFDRRKRGHFKIENRVSIHERPEIVAAKVRFGDWEDDTMIFSKQKEVLAVQYERKSMLCRLTKLSDKTAAEHENAVWKSIESLPPELWKTITRDNGTENANHEQTKNIFNIQSFFCDGYCSWQKCGIECNNKQTRQYLPRWIDLSKLDDNDIFQIQEKLNNRPRKTLNYFSPNEVISQFVKK